MGWLSGWAYRRPIRIDNTRNSNNLTNYQVLVTVDTASLISAGKMRSDCGDIRFTDIDGVTILPYWIESGVNTTTTKIWVKVPSIPASSVYTIYMYYGNPNALSASDPTQVFIRIIDGLILSYHFDEGSGSYVYDSSGNNITGTLVNNPAWVDGKFGKAISLNGSNQYIDCGKPSVLMNLTNNFTVTAWFKKASSADRYAQICGDGQLTGGSGGFIIGVYSGYPNNWKMTKWGVVDIYIGTPPADTLWHFIAGRYSSSAGVNVVLDGSLNGSSSNTSNLLASTGNFVIGLGQGAYHYGLIDEFNVYNRVLSDAELSDLYNNYGYSTPSYPGKTLVRKYSYPEPYTYLDPEETILAPPPFIPIEELKKRLIFTTTPSFLSLSGSGSVNILSPSADTKTLTVRNWWLITNASGGKITLASPSKLFGSLLAKKQKKTGQEDIWTTLGMGEPILLYYQNIAPDSKVLVLLSWRED